MYLHHPSELHLGLRNEAIAERITVLQGKGWLETVKPAHDAVTQHAPEWDKATGQWVVRDKTAEELAAEQAAKDDTTEKQTIKAYIAALQAGTGTTAERFKRVERVCAYLLKHL